MLIFSLKTKVEKMVEIQNIYPNFEINKFSFEIPYHYDLLLCDEVRTLNDNKQAALKLNYLPIQFPDGNFTDNRQNNVSVQSLEMDLKNNPFLQKLILANCFSSDYSQMWKKKFEKYNTTTELFQLIKNTNVSELFLLLKNTRIEPYLLNNIKRYISSI